MVVGIDEISFGVIGCGSFSRVLVPFLQEQSEAAIVGVCDAQSPASQSLGEDLGVPWYVDPEDLLARTRPQAVLILTPHYTHHDLAVLAAQAGCHIFCEKAMALTVAECQAMADAARVNGVKLMVGHMNRLRPEFATMADVLRDGRIGRPLTANVHAYHWNIWGKESWWACRAEVGGLLHWAGVHEIDTLRFFLGEVASVFAVEGPKVYEGTDYADSTAVTLRFQTGSIATLQVSPYFPSRPYLHSFSWEIVCEHGGLRYDPERITVEWQRAGEEARSNHFVDFPTASTSSSVAYRRELANFIGWILRDEQPVLTWEDGLRVVEIIEAAYLSAKSGQVVSLPINDEATF